MRAARQFGKRGAAPQAAESTLFEVGGWPPYRPGDRVRDLGDGRKGTVVAVARWEVRWRPDFQPRPYTTEIYTSSPSMIERL